MRYLIATLLAALVFSLPAGATERVLLALPGAAATVATTPAAGATLLALRKAAHSSGKVRVIVGLRVPFAAEGSLSTGERKSQRSDIANAARALRARLGGASIGAMQGYASLPFVALEVTQAQLDSLAADPSVVSISEDIMLRANLAQSAPLIRAPQAWAAGYTGAGATVAILDTGVDKNHPFLAGKVIAEACYSSGGFCPGGARSSTASGSGLPCPYTYACAHGTHVAGIAAGRGDSASGIAKDASIIAVQVFSPDPHYPRDVTAFYGDVLAALDHVYDLRSTYKIAAVNMSLGSGRFRASCDNTFPAMTAAIANLRSAGIATVISSGNDGYVNAIEFPACISSAVSVGAVSDADWGPCTMRVKSLPTAADKVACYSNTASFLSVLAPGSAITSSVPGGGYETWHGTSMAAPHVTGAFAVLRQKFPDVPVGDLVARLQGSGAMISDYRSPRIVRPRIDVEAALTYSVPVYALSYTMAGSGAGSVTFAPAGSAASCGASCTQNFASSTVVTLTATPASNARFAGWSGACTKRKSCVITMSQARSVTATFIAR